MKTQQEKDMSNRETFGVGTLHDTLRKHLDETPGFVTPLTEQKHMTWQLWPTQLASKYTQTHNEIPMVQAIARTGCI